MSDERMNLNGYFHQTTQTAMYLKFFGGNGEKTDVEGKKELANMRIIDIDSWILGRKRLIGLEKRPFFVADKLHSSSSSPPPALRWIFTFRVLKIIMQDGLRPKRKRKRDGKRWYPEWNSTFCYHVQHIRKDEVRSKHFVRQNHRRAERILAKGGRKSLVCRHLLQSPEWKKLYFEPENSWTDQVSI